MQGAQGLSAGTIEQLLQEKKLSGPFYFQVLGQRAIASKTANPDTAPKRFRLLMSDGVHSTTMMPAAQLNEELHAQSPLQEGTVVRVGEVLVNKGTGKSVLIILTMEQVGFHQGAIGNPQPYNDQAAAASVPANAAVPSQHQQAVPQSYGNPPGPSYSQPSGPAYSTTSHNIQTTGPAYGAPPQAQTAGPAYGGPPAMQNDGPGFGYGQAPVGPSYGGPPGGFTNQQQGGMPSAGHMNTGAMQGHAGMPSGPAGFGGGAAAYGTGSGPAAPYSRPVPPPQYGGAGAVARNEAPARIVPIKSLNPFSGRWTIKARCTSKAELKRWSNNRGEGKLFSFDLLDSQGGEIRVTAFNDQVDKFFPLIEVGRVYLVSKGKLQQKKPQFNHTNHDFEIQLERDTVIEACVEDAEAQAIPDILYHFRPISELGATEAGAVVDVIGIVENVDNWQTITKKNGEEVRKRSMVLRDRSGGSIELTLWGQHTSDPGDALYAMCQAGERPVFAIKGARVGDFNGKNLSTVNGSTVRVRPDIPEAAALMAWYASGGSSERVNALSGAGGGGGGGGGKRCTLSSIRDEDLGRGEKPDWITVAGTISYIRQDSGGSSVVYPSCPGEFNGRACSKKLTEGGGQWYCERCSKYPGEPVWRYLVSLQVSDHTGVQWLTCFGESGELMFDGLKAPELKALESENDKEFEKRIWDANLNRMVFRLKVAEDTYQDERKVKVSVFKMDHMDYSRECKITLDLISKLEAGQPVLQAKAPDVPHGMQYGTAGTQQHAANTNPYSTAPSQPQQRQGWGGGGGSGAGFGTAAYGSPQGTRPYNAGGGGGGGFGGSYGAGSDGGAGAYGGAPGGGPGSGSGGYAAAPGAGPGSGGAAYGPPSGGAGSGAAGYRGGPGSGGAGGPYGSGPTVGPGSGGYSAAPGMGPGTGVNALGGGGGYDGAGAGYGGPAGGAYSSVPVGGGGGGGASYGGPGMAGGGSGYAGVTSPTGGFNGGAAAAGQLHGNVPGYGGAPQQHHQQQAGGNSMATPPQPQPYW